MLRPVRIMLRPVKRVVKSPLKFADSVLRRLSPTYRAKRKYASELDFWNGGLDHLRRWYEDGAIDWWGIPPPSAEKKQRTSDVWAVNAVMTMHDIRPSYLEELHLERDCFRGKRVLEVGCGPLAPILQFSDCVRHGLDPLIDLYLQSGWPLYDYDVKFVSAKGESMPYVGSYFDAAISVNALDHVDDFRQVASEIQRVVKVGGELYFEIEYHAPTVNEPQRLNDTTVLESFSACEMRKVCERGKREMFQAVVKRFGLIPGKFDHFTNEERFVTWHGKRLR
jgi:ubiquinone/menaquinone biosynthesis C-methylase UbiE